MIFYKNNKSDFLDKNLFYNNFSKKFLEKLGFFLFVFFGLGVFHSLYFKKWVFVILFLVPIFFFGTILYRHWNFYRKRFKNFASGIDGEKNVLEILKKLGEDFLIVQSMPLQKSDLDFLVFRKDIVFALEVKNHRGKISYQNGVLLSNDKPFKKDFLYQIEKQKKDLERFLFSKISASPPKIVSVLVFSNPLAHVSKKYLDFRNLINILQSEDLIWFMQNYPKQEYKNNFTFLKEIFKTNSI